MFGDIVKIGVRTGAVIAVIGAIVGVLSLIIIPSPDYSFFSVMIGKGYALMLHWVPGFQFIFNFFTVTLGAWLIIQTMRFSIYASSIVLKIFQ